MNRNLLNDSEEMLHIRDWRKALRSPPTYRIGQTTFRLRFYIILLIFGIGALIFFYYTINKSSSISPGYTWLVRNSDRLDQYNQTYPLSVPINSNGIVSYRIGLIADLDTNSIDKKKGNEWKSYFKKGYLSYSSSSNKIVISWDNSEPLELKTNFAAKGRGMELSELVTFNGRLLSFDDRTGIVYTLSGDRALPWTILLDGDGSVSKGFKSEWATVKDNILYVGSMGKEWTTSAGEFENVYPMYVKALTPEGVVYHFNWENHFKKLREAIGIKWPGYMIHESAVWSPIHRKWYFLPRRCSKEKYNETTDEHKGCDVLLSADENFTRVTVVHLNQHKPTHGFSSFKFLPETNDELIVAIKTEELNGKTSTFITAFTTNGNIILPEEQVPTEFKYEGIEFI